MNFKLASDDTSGKTIPDNNKQSAAAKSYREIVYHKYQKKSVYQISAATTMGY
jgi:hypothetical protein